MPRRSPDLANKHPHSADQDVSVSISGPHGEVEIIDLRDDAPILEYTAETPEDDFRRGVDIEAALDIGIVHVGDLSSSVGKRAIETLTFKPELDERQRVQEARDMWLN